MTIQQKKLIEVALPLEAINREAAREKSIRHGHPSTLHLWWARRPLAACRAVIFAQLVDDPSSWPRAFPTEEDQNRERRRLFRVIEKLVKWENSADEEVLHEARIEIARSMARTKGLQFNPKMSKEETLSFLAKEAPPILDPFSGGGSIPLEAQRLGLRARASDLNPVAELITKALIEIPPRFAGRLPVNPEAKKQSRIEKGQWKGAKGLAADVRYYGQWMRQEAEKRIGSLYPKIAIPRELGGGERPVIAWLWARTVSCQNPSCGAQTPIAKSFQLSGKKGREVYANPVVDKKARSVRFQIRDGTDAPEGNAGRNGARCLVCSSPITLTHIRDEATAGRTGQTLLAIVAEGDRRRVYVEPNDEHQNAALVAAAKVEAWRPTTELPAQALGFRVQRYGMTTHASLFSVRQLVALSTFSGLVSEVERDVAQRSGDPEYAAAVATYLAFAVSKSANYWSSLCSWYVNLEKMVSTFGLPTLSMVWDFAEANPFSDSSGNWMLGVEQAADVLDGLPTLVTPGIVKQVDAAQHLGTSDELPAVVTDPPYYDNIGYAALSDFFYVWLRRTVGHIYRDSFSTVLTPKMQELIAEPGRFENDRDRAVEHFERGLSKAFELIRAGADPQVPVSLFYAFKQQESSGEDDDESSRVSSGWEKMLSALMRAGFAVQGTWPMRTEQTGGLREAKRNSLASSIVLVCRPRPKDARMATRQEFVRALKQELPPAIRKLQQGAIAPVDLAQAAIGPGMAIFSRFQKVMEADGTSMSVRTALSLINQMLDQVLAEQETEFDADTRWCVAWFEQYGLEEAQYGVAETLTKAKNTSVGGLETAGVLVVRPGKVRLKRRDELEKGWTPAEDQRFTVWEATQQLIWALENGGETSASELLRQLGSVGEVARDLAYRLYTTSEKKGWNQEAAAYNGLVVAWPEISRLAAGIVGAQGQTTLNV